MRLQLAPNIDSRDGVSNKDSRLINALGEMDDGENMAVVRPGLATLSTSSGDGRGLCSFNDVVISIYGTTLGHGATPATIGTVSGAFFDFTQSPL